MVAATSTGTAATRSTEVPIAALHPGHVLATGLMSGIPNVAPPVACLIWLEMVEGSYATFRKRPMISTPRIVPVVYVAVESTWPVEPRTRPDEYVAYEPIGPIISVRRAVVRGVIEVAVWAVWRRPYGDRNLCWRNGNAGQQQSCNRRHQENGFEPEHRVLLPVPPLVSFGTLV